MPIAPIEMTVESQTGTVKRTIEIGSLSGARFSARDVAATRKQMDEQIARDGHFTMLTATNPSICRMGRYLLTQDERIEVQGTMTGGEAEAVAIRDGGEILITIGSDQCDRELDELFPDKPKQMCPHPIAATAWPYDEVKDHWDQLRVYSHVVVGGHTVTLQDTALDTLVDLEYLLAMDTVRQLTDPAFLYCGAAPFVDSLARTIKQHGLPEQTEHGIGDRFLARLHDPVLDRSIEHQFTQVVLGDQLEERRRFPRPVGRYIK
jgi:hypothetical protein